MKTNKLIAAALLPLLFSCAKENIEPSTDPVSDEKYVTVNLVPDEDSITKATYDDEKGIIWQPGGKAGIISAKDDYYILEESKPLELKKIYDFEDPANKDIKSAQASFDFVLGIADDYKGYFKFFYPYHSEAKVTKGDNPYIRIPFSVDPNQTSGVGKSSDNFAVVSKDMLQLDQTNHDTPAVTYYKVVGSYIRFLVYGKPGEKVKSISIKSAQKPSGLYFVNGGNNDLTGEPYANDGEIVTVSVSEDYTTPATISDAKGIYASVLPERALKNTYTVETDKGWYKFESQNEANFAFGSIKDVLLNLENTKCKYAPAKLFIIGGATTAGWHAENAIPLTKVEGKHQFELKGIQLNAGEGDSGFKFLTQQGSWDNVYVNGKNDNKTITYYEKNPDEAEDIKFSVPVSGYYDVLVDFDTNQVTCTLLPQVYTYPEGSEVKVNMSCTETKDVYKAIIYLASGDKKHDFKINYNNQFYHVARTDYQEVNFSPAEEQHTVGYDWAVVADDTANGWWVYNEYCNKYYEVTLDLTDPKNKKVSLKLAQGNSYWITGYQFGRDDKDTWLKKDENKRKVENGKVTWEFEIPDGGGFNIVGEYDEYYNSTSTDGYWNWKSDTYGWTTVYATFKNGNQPWNFTEKGKFKVTFWPSTLQIKVEKN